MGYQPILKKKSKVKEKPKEIYELTRTYQFVNSKGFLNNQKYIAIHVFDALWKFIQDCYNANNWKQDPKERALCVETQEMINIYTRYDGPSRYPRCYLDEPEEPFKSYDPPKKEEPPRPVPTSVPGSPATVLQ